MGRHRVRGRFVRVGVGVGMGVDVRRNLVRLLLRGGT